MNIIKKINCRIKPTGFILFFILFTIYGASDVSAFSLIKPKDLDLNKKDQMILDARPKAVWEKGHIPTAISFSWEDYTRTDEQGVPYRIFPPKDMVKKLGQLGIDENTEIVVYGDADTSWGGEGWVIWLFTYLGHKGKISLLDGGITSWEKNGFQLSKQNDTRLKQPRPYAFQINSKVIISTGDLVKNAGAYYIVDTRSLFERIKSSIKGSIPISWTDFYSGDDRKPIDGKALNRLLTQHGIDSKKPVVYYCTGGIRSAYAWAVHAQSGFGPALNYEEGMEAWSRKK